MHYKQIIGKVGEDRACQYLYEKGYDILERNFRCRGGEIDIIAKDKSGELVFVEVKTRRNLDYGRPSEAVNNLKRKHIHKVAKFYILKNKLNNPKVRFDIIEVLIRKTYFIHHIKQAF